MKPFIDECGIIHIAYMATAMFLSKEVVTTSDLFQSDSEIFPSMSILCKITTIARCNVVSQSIFPFYVDNLILRISYTQIFEHENFCVFTKTI